MPVHSRPPVLDLAAVAICALAWGTTWFTITLQLGVVDPVVSLVLAYATFAVGFVVRPIGGIMLGAYADRYGRRRALSLLLGAFAASSLLMIVVHGLVAVGARMRW